MPCIHHTLIVEILNQKDCDRMISNLLKKLRIHNKNKSSVNPEELKTAEEKLKIQQEIHEICLEMEKTNRWFQMESDKDLIDACIHQREVLNARYRYLMNKIKPLESQ